MRKLYALVVILGLMVLPTAIYAVDTSVPRIAKEDLKAKMERGEDILILDVRTGGSYSGSKVKIKGAMRMPPGEVDMWSKNLPKHKEIITYCT